MTAEEWIESLAAELGVPAPSQSAIDDVLELAGVAAHATERWTAPVSCWLAAKAGRSPSEALDLARRLAGDA